MSNMQNIQKEKILLIPTHGNNIKQIFVSLSYVFKFLINIRKHTNSYNFQRMYW